MSIFFTGSRSLFSGFKIAKPAFHTIYHFVLFSGYEKLNPSPFLFRYFANNQL